MKNDISKKDDEETPAFTPDSGTQGFQDRLSADNWLNIFNSVADPAMILDNNYCIRLANSSMAAFLGLPEEEITGRKCYELCHGTQSPVALCPNRRVLQDGKPHTEELVEPRTGKPVQITSSPIYDASGSCSGTIHFVKDMTEHYSLLAMLKSSRDIYRTVVDEQTEMILRFDAEGLITFANDVCCQFAGKPRQELLGSRWNKKICIEEVHLLEAELSVLTSENPLAAVECLMVDGSGGSHWIHFICRGFFDSSGELSYVQLVGRDITDSKKSELQLHDLNAELKLRIVRQTETLSESEQFLRIVLDAVNAGLWVWRLNTDRHYWSEQLWGLFCLEPHSCPPSCHAWQESVHPDDRGDAEQKLREAVNNGLETSLEFRTGTCGHAERWLTYHGRPVRRGDGRVETYVGIVQDVTGRKLSEASQQQVNSLVQELALAEERERCRIADELHDQLAPNLLVCMMKLNSLRESLTLDTENDTVGYIENLLSDAIQDIRSLTFQLRPPLLANAGLTAALKWLASEFSEKYGLNVSIDDSNSWHLLDFALRSTLFQVVRELLFNVAKHARVTDARLSISRQGDQVVICVEDDGVGFDAEPAAVFTAGSGFGLFNIRQKVEHLGGVLRFDSAPGCGTRAIVTVPAASVDRNEELSS